MPLLIDRLRRIDAFDAVGHDLWTLIPTVLAMIGDARAVQPLLVAHFLFHTRQHLAGGYGEILGSIQAALASGFGIDKQKALRDFPAALESLVRTLDPKELSLLRRRLSSGGFSLGLTEVDAELVKKLWARGDIHARLALGDILRGYFEETAIGDRLPGMV